MQTNDNYRAPHWRSSPGLIPAIIIIGIGVLLLLSNLHIVYVENWWRYWPVLVIAGGLAKILDTDQHQSRILGALIVGVGGLFLLNNFNLIELTWDAFWPIVLIGIGVLMLFNRLTGPLVLTRKGAVPPPAEGTFVANAIFSGFKRKITDGDFRGAHLTAIFGGGELNLRQARMEGDSAVVYASAIFGGIEIKVPDHWQVTSDGTGIFGGFSDETAHPPEGTPGLKRLIIKGEAVFGGVEVKN
jgi:predicted membrane protein